MSDLVKIRGIGDVMEATLNKNGISTYAQIAAMTDEEAVALDLKLNLKSMITRFEWREQAAELDDSPPVAITEESTDTKVEDFTVATHRMSMYLGNEQKTFDEGDIIPAGYKKRPVDHPHDER